mmetsp:Transcript_57208/g.117083  ORF Transcript_57208/g.117083 Transcript_57208/m.117083 type:complete len:225 (-) Transcript_57208:431-1105(-)
MTIPARLLCNKRRVVHPDRLDRFTTLALVAPLYHSQVVPFRTMKWVLLEVLFAMRMHNRIPICQTVDAIGSLLLEGILVANFKMFDLGTVRRKSRSTFSPKSVVFRDLCEECDLDEDVSNHVVFVTKRQDGDICVECSFVQSDFVEQDLLYLKKLFKTEAVSQLNFLQRICSLSHTEDVEWLSLLHPSKQSGSRLIPIAQIEWCFGFNHHCRFRAFHLLVSPRQ